MTRRKLLQTVMLAVAVALATALLGWWAVPLLGLVWGVAADPADHPALEYSLASGLGWVSLLIWTASQGPIGAVAERTAGVMGVRSQLLYAITFLFPVALGWSAAVAGEMLRHLFFSSPSSESPSSSSDLQ